MPLFVEELTKAVVEAGADRGYASISAVPPSALAVPATLHASLLGRLDRLGSAAKTVAQVGAAVGRDFSYELLAAVVRLAEPELQEALRRLVEAGLVFQRGMPPTAEYLFKHALAQDTAQRVYCSVARGLSAVPSGKSLNSFSAVRLVAVADPVRTSWAPLSPGGVIVVAAVMTHSRIYTVSPQVIFSVRITSRLTGRIECLSLCHNLGRLAPLLGVIADRKEPANNWDQAGIMALKAATVSGVHCTFCGTCGGVAHPISVSAHTATASID